MQARLGLPLSRFRTRLLVVLHPGAAYLLGASGRFLAHADRWRAVRVLADAASPCSPGSCRRYVSPKPLFWTGAVALLAMAYPVAHTPSHCAGVGLGALICFDSVGRLAGVCVAASAQPGD